MRQLFHSISWFLVHVAAQIRKQFPANHLLGYISSFHIWLALLTYLSLSSCYSLSQENIWQQCRLQFQTSTSSQLTFTVKRRPPRGPWASWGPIYNSIDGFFICTALSRRLNNNNRNGWHNCFYLTRSSQDLAFGLIGTGLPNHRMILCELSASTDIILARYSPGTGHRLFIALHLCMENSTNCWHVFSTSLLLPGFDLSEYYVFRAFKSLPPIPSLRYAALDSSA